MTETQRLLSEIEAAAMALKTTPLAVCARAVGNGRLVERLRNGKSCSIETAARIRAFIAANSSKSETEAA